ncbi:MAG: DUF2110 family protein [Candidatus Bathyarchaeia archaeon]
MPTVTLSAKIYNEHQIRFVEKFLESTLKGLNVETKICGITPTRMVQVGVSGEDENVALRYLTEKVGVCPTSIEQLKKNSEVKGYITALNKNASELYIDIGVYMPTIINATIPIQHLQAQLADGRKVALQKLIELYGFCENLPINIKILSVNKEEKRIEATFSESQFANYKNWIKSLLDRLIIIGATPLEVKLTLKRVRANRDVISVEPLGLFENALVCKLGTDAEGLIPKIGGKLRNATLTVFSPKKVLEFLDYSPIFAS